jgi:glycosyltransferase involved in cell wall biosynthesis
MRILAICHEFPPLGWGAGKQLEQLARIIGSQHELVVLTVGFESFGSSRQDGYALHRIDTGRQSTDVCTLRELLRFTWKSWRLLPSVIREHRPDAVLMFFTVPEGLLLFHPAMRNVPAVVSVRGSDVPGHDSDRPPLLYRMVTPLVRRVWRRAGAVVCNSDDLKREALQVCPGLEVEVIPNGVDTGRFSPTDKPSQRTGPVLLYCGRLIPLKRIDVMVRAISLLREQGLHAGLRIVGVGPQDASLRELVAGHQLEDAVEFAGAIDSDEMHRAYQRADLYIQLSRVEGMSNSILEAMASGLPIITTGVGGAADLIDGNGVVLESPEVIEVAGAIRLYLEDASLCQSHGRRSRLLVQRFSLETAASRYLRLMSSVAANR